MNRAFKFVRDFFLVNTGWKLLALAIAVVLWAVVASEPELGTLVTVPLEYRNLPDDLEISSEPVSQIVLELRGPSGELRGVGDSGLHPAVILDMSGSQPGVHTFPISRQALKLPRGVRLERANPSEVRFEFDRRATRAVPVRPQLTGQGQDGYQIVAQSVSPAELQIEGPAKAVARVRDVVTDPVDVSGVVGASEFRVNAYVDNPYVRFRSAPQVVVTVTMKKK
jgi:YbbR domain-containing protein